MLLTDEEKQATIRAVKQRLEKIDFLSSTKYIQKHYSRLYSEEKRRLNFALDKLEPSLVPFDIPND